MGDKKILTKSEFERLKKELEELKLTKRPEIAKRLQEAKAQGDLSENAEYSEARDAQGFVESRIQFLENILSVAEVVNFNGKCPASVNVGTFVVVNIDGKEQEFEIVGVEGADPLNFKISIDSPMGKALQGLKVGDKTKFKAPNGEKAIAVKGIRC